MGPACNAALFGYQTAITLDRLRGRVISVIFLAAMSLSSLAALMSGVLVHTWDGPAAIVVFAAVMAISAIAATASKGMRKMRPLSEIAAAG